MDLKEYSAEISLFEPWIPPSPARYQPEREKIVLDLIQYIENRVGRIDFDIPNGGNERRGYLRGLLNTLPPGILGVREKELLDSLLQGELIEKNLFDPNREPDDARLIVGGTGVVLWQGDITHVRTDVIVNAANNRLLGCFQPGHNCIDNAIHSAAGVRLRDDCQLIIRKQGNLEATGACKITRGYNLPSRFVLHTVGPIVEGKVTPQNERELASCYTCCLERAAEIPEIRSIAFCCISTGVFGYPQEAAAIVATKCVLKWLKEHSGRFNTVLFNVFTDRDRDIYTELLSHG